MDENKQLIYYGINDMEIESEIIVLDVEFPYEGKYTFIRYKEDYRVHCLRYGEPWMIFEKGCNAIAALMNDYEEILELLEKLK